MSECVNCGEPANPKAKTGLCLRCFRKHGFAAIRRLDPGFEARRVEGIRANYKANPEWREKISAIAKATARRPEVKEAKRQSAKRRRIWEKGNAVRPPGSPSRMLAGKRVSDTKLAWCPPELRDDYRKLCRLKHYRAAEAKAMILEQHETAMRRWRESIGATGPAPEVNAPRLVDSGSEAEINERTAKHLEKVKAEKERIEALRVDNTLCPTCGTRASVGCEHSRMAA